MRPEDLPESSLKNTFGCHSSRRTSVNRTNRNGVFVPLRSRSFVDVREVFEKGPFLRSKSQELGTTPTADKTGENFASVKVYVVSIYQKLSSL